MRRRARRNKSGPENESRTDTDRELRIERVPQSNVLRVKRYSDVTLVHTL